MHPSPHPSANPLPPVRNSSGQSPLRWVETPGVGYCAQLPGGRYAYVEPSRKPGQYRLRIVSRPGQRLGDFYAVKPTAEECKALAAERAGKAS